MAEDVPDDVLGAGWRSEGAHVAVVLSGVVLESRRLHQPRRHVRVILSFSQFPSYLIHLLVKLRRSMKTLIRTLINILNMASHLNL